MIAAPAVRLDMVSSVTDSRSPGRRRMSAVLLVAGFVVVACGDDAIETSSVPSWSAWSVAVERNAAPSDVGPLCLPFSGDVSGTYTEYESPDGSTAVAVFELLGDSTDLEALGELYRRLGECSDDSLRVEQISESASSVAWRVQVMDGDVTGKSELVGFTADGDSVRVVTGLESTWADLGGEDAWLL